MDYSSLLTRARNIVWNHKFLIILGVIASLGGGAGGGGGNNFQLPNNGNQFSPSGPNFGNGPGIPNFNSPQMQSAIFLIGAIVVGAFLIGLISSLVSSFFVWVAEGATIGAVNQIETGENPTFEQAWRLGWAKKWRLFGIGVVTVLPVFVIVMVAVIAAIIAMFPAISALSSSRDPQAYVSFFLGIFGYVVAFCCCLILLGIPLTLIRLAADRACMLQDASFSQSFSQGWGVLRANLGNALVLYLIQFLIQIGIGLVMLVVAFVLAFCAGGWLLIMTATGAVEAFFSAVWTLAWRDWVSRPVIEAPPAAKPA